MKSDKYAEIKVGILFIVGVIVGGYKFLNVDGIVFVGVVLTFLICGYMAGKNEIYKQYENMHYSALEDDARKRKVKDKKLWDDIRKQAEASEE